MCYKCKKNTVNFTISRFSLCPICSSDLHCCLNCKFYDAQSHYECHETIDELVKDKEKANFCEFFAEKNYGDKNVLGASSEKSQNDKARDAKNKFESLFK